MGEKYFQECGPNFPWMKHIFGKLVPIFMGEKYLQEFGPIFLEALSLWVRCRRRLFFFQKNGLHIFGSPEFVGTLPQAPFFFRKNGPQISGPFFWKQKPTMGFESPWWALKAHIPKTPFPRPLIHPSNIFQRQRHNIIKFALQNSPEFRKIITNKSPHPGWIAARAAGWPFQRKSGKQLKPFICLQRCPHVYL